MFFCRKCCKDTSTSILLLPKRATWARRKPLWTTAPTSTRTTASSWGRRSNKTISPNRRKTCDAPESNSSFVGACFRRETSTSSTSASWPDSNTPSSIWRDSRKKNSDWKMTKSVFGAKFWPQERQRTIRRKFAFNGSQKICKFKYCLYSLS